MLRISAMLTLSVTLSLIYLASVEAAEKLLFPQPDINQLDAGQDGEIACGPAAAANYILWLSSNGLSSLAAIELGPKPVLAELQRLMETQGRGTSAEQFSNGIQSFFKAKGVPVAQLDCFGWRSGCAGDAPQLGKLKEILKRGGGVFLNFGWYQAGSNGEYIRTGGHWVSLVGFGVDGQGNDAPGTLIVHDPSPRCGSTPRNEFLPLKKLHDRSFLVSKESPVIDGRGYYYVDSGWRMPRRADVGILDAAVCLVPGRAH